jgi:hypothetical protein
MIRQLLSITADSSKQESRMEQGFNIPFLAPQIHSLFSPVRRLSSSRKGDLYSLGFDNKFQDCWILMYPSAGKEWLYACVHSTVVSYCLNSLRERTTGFQYGYGGLFCSMKEHLCDTRYPATYLSLFEFIPGESLEAAIDTIQRTELLRLLLQISHILALAQREYRFRHNRLYARNIILRREPSTKKRSFGSYSFTSNIQPSIIDYSMSMIFHSTHQEWISPKEYSTYPIDKAETDIPMWDIIVLLHSLMYQCYQRRGHLDGSLLTLITQLFHWIQNELSSTNVSLIEDVIKVEQFPYAEILELPSFSYSAHLVEVLSSVKLENWMRYIASLLT